MGDAGDSKSPGPCARAGSNPASGTNIINGLRGLHIRWKFLGCLDCARFAPPPPLPPVLAWFVPLERVS